VSTEPHQIWSGIPDGVREVLDEVVGATRGEEVLIVGGFVRDLFLDRHSRDLDLVVTGDAGSLSRRLSRRLDVPAKVHPEFGTATLSVGRLRLDIATARKERYAVPAALPDVKPGTLSEDLARRDFSINAMALEVTPNEGRLVDLHDGQEDLLSKRLRLLHRQSIRDDPTRAFRGVRLEQELGFEMDHDATRQIEGACERAYFDELSGSRLREEFFRTLTDPGLFGAGFCRLGDLGLLRAIHPQVAWNSDLGEQARAAELEIVEAAARGRAVDPPLVALILLSLQLSDEGGAEICDRLALQRRDRRALVGGFRRIRNIAESLVAHDVSQLVTALERMRIEELIGVLAAAGERARGWRELVWRAWDHVPVVTAAELVASGCPEGPALGEVLLATRAARIQDLVGKEDEVEYALNLMKRYLQ